MYDEFDVMSVPGATGVKRTAELKMALRSFLAQCGAACYEDENSKDILKCYSRLQNGMCVEQEIHVGDTDYVCYTNLAGRVNEDASGAMTELILAANEVNRELKYGNFEIDVKNETVCFRSYYEPLQEICMGELDRLVGEPLWAIETYAARLLFG